jgi:hypothetical protein
MDQRQIKKADKGVQYSLLMTIELDFNIKEEKLFNECIDSVARVDPKKFCLDTVAVEAQFEFWNRQDVESMCKTAATQVILGCADGQKC